MNFAPHIGINANVNAKCSFSVVKCPLCLSHHQRAMPCSLTVHGRDFWDSSEPGDFLPGVYLVCVWEGDLVQERGFNHCWGEGWLVAVVGILCSARTNPTSLPCWHVAWVQHQWGALLAHLGDTLAQHLVRSLRTFVSPPSWIVPLVISREQGTLIFVLVL